MLRITREEALRGLVDFGRIEEMLARTGGRVDHVVLDQVTPLAAPMLLEMGRVPVEGAAVERLLAEEAAGADAGGRVWNRACFCRAAGYRNKG